MVCRAVSAGLKVQVTVIGVAPDATLLRHPGMRFPAKRKVTFPVTETETLAVIDTPLEIESGTVSVTVICETELLVIDRVEIAVISFPAESIQRPLAAPPDGA